MDYEPSYKEFATIFKALSDETRLCIVDMLSCAELSACDILKNFTLSQSTLSAAKACGRSTPSMTTPS